MIYTDELLVAQTKVRIISNRIPATARPRATSKWKHILKKMIIPEERIAEESDDIAASYSDTALTNDVDRVPQPESASIGVIGKTTPGIL